MLAFGVMFQTPAVVLLAVKLGVVTSAQLCDKRPYVLTGILILSAILTPPDVISQLMLAVPTWLLFEGGLKIASYIEKKSVKPAFKESMN
jgi:sec-independent protein translocase protein TatC